MSSLGEAAVAKEQFGQYKPRMNQRAVEFLSPFLVATLIFLAVSFIYPYVA